jgi:hypothetical protein
MPSRKGLRDGFLISSRGAGERVLLIGLAGASGSGKTYTAMRLAKGIAGDKPFAVIDTEAGARSTTPTRSLRSRRPRAPVPPRRLRRRDRGGRCRGLPGDRGRLHVARVGGPGGILDWQEEEFKRLGSKDSIKLLSWSKPKQAHKDMVQRCCRCART